MRWLCHNFSSAGRPQDLISSIIWSLNKYNWDINLLAAVVPDLHATCVFFLKHLEKPYLFS